MAKTQTIEDFYRNQLNQSPAGLKNDIVHFNVFNFRDCVEGKTVEYNRRDFFKIALMQGDYLYHYADKSLAVSGSTLLFFNPDIPYTFEASTADIVGGYFCIFREPFFTEHYRSGIRNLPMFAPGGKPGYPLDTTQAEEVNKIFMKMQQELASDYVYKFDLIRNYITELIHYALKLKPEEILNPHIDANTRITAVFNELLERQFPIENSNQRFKLRSAKDFADQLAIHVNHLNRAIRLTTGKTTTAHISERLTAEAMALLKHTDWNISEIGYCLGFEDHTHFNQFFKKQTNTSPSAYRS